MRLGRSTAIRRATLAIASALALAPLMSYAARLDATSLRDDPKPEKGPWYHRGPNKRGTPVPKHAFQQDPAELKASVKSLDILIARTPKGPAQDKLWLNRAMGWYSLGQQRIVAGKDPAPDKEARQSFEQAIVDANRVAVSKFSDNEVRSKARYLAGMGYVYLDKPRDAHAQFAEALRLDPQTENATWMALYMAEESFDRGDFFGAMNLYRQYYNRFGAQEKELAAYKMAWCHLNLNDLGKAEALFTKLVKANPKEGFGKDSVKDLAYVLTNYRSEEQILEISEDLFAKDAALKIDFLNAVNGFLQAQNSPNSKILAVLLKLEKDPARRVALLLSNVKSHRREYASIEHMKSWLVVKHQLERDKFSPTSKDAEAFAPSLDLETQKIMRSYVETFAGRTKTPDNLSKDDLGKSLKMLFAFHDEWFAEGKTRPVVYGLWLDVCSDVKDWSCVRETAETIEKTDNLASLKERGRIDEIVALEELVKEQHDKYADELLHKLETFHKENTGSARWVEISGRLGEVYEQAKNFDAAMPVYENLFNKEHSADALYRLQWARYQSGHYEDVADEKRAPSVSGEKRVPASAEAMGKLEAVRREASLKLASHAKTDGKIADYSSRMRLFLALNPAPEKAAAARKDLYSTMLDAGQYKEVTEELLKLKPADRFAGGVRPVLDRTLMTNLEHARFSSASALVAGHPPEPEQEYQAMLTELAQGAHPEPKRIHALAQDKREYILGTLALTHAKDVEAYMRAYPPRVENEKQLLLLSLRMESGQWDYKPTRSIASVFGTALPEGVDTGAPTRSEELTKKVWIPSYKVKPQTLLQATKDAVIFTRRVRQQAAKDLAKRPYEVQLRIVRNAKALEERMSKFILGSPVPKGLPASKVGEYKEGLVTFASEFEEQANEFAKVEQSIVEAQTKAKEETEGKVPPQPELSSWPWPESWPKDDGPFAGVKAAVDHGNTAGALVALDMMRSQKEVDDNAYWAVRSGVLLSMPESEVMRRYVVEELRQNSQHQLVTVWRGLKI